jgi:regulator of protease activity HflC (stomatin/prohibitin superfamily)
MGERYVFDAKEVLQSVRKKGPMRLIVIIGVILIFFLLLKPWVQIGAGERGVVLNFGAVQDNVLGEGLHFRIPIMQSIAIMDVKVQKAVTDATSASSDLQDVTSSVALNYHIIPDKVNSVYQTIGVEFKERVIDPAIQEVMKAV